MTELKFKKGGKYIVTDLQKSGWNEFDSTKQEIEVLNEYDTSYLLRDQFGSSFTFSKKWRYRIEECLNPNEIVDVEEVTPAMVDQPNNFSGAKRQMEKEIREAIVFLRDHNHTIPSETIEFMKVASLALLSKK